MLDRAPTQEEADAAAAAFAGGGTRIAFLDAFLRSDEVAARCAALGIRAGSVPAETLAAAAGSGGRTPEISAVPEKKLPQSGGYAFGTLTSKGTVDLDGLSGRVDFFVDGALVNQTFSTASNVAVGAGSGTDGSGPSAYDVVWNADLEATGPHGVAVLARRADGRGLLLDGGAYVVPEIRDLAPGTPLAGGVSTGGTPDFYRISAVGGLLSFHAVYPAAPETPTAFARAGEPLAADVATGASFASIALRADLGTTVYVEVAPGAATGTSAATVAPYYALLDSDAAVVDAYGASITLRAAPGGSSASAGSLGNGAVAALVGEGTDSDGETWYQLRANGVEGYAYSGSVHALRFDGRLDTLSVSPDDGTSARLSPRFDAETVDYGLVLDPSAHALDLSYAAREGGLADASAAVVAADGSEQAVTAGSKVTVPAGSNVIRLRVVSSDRTTVREYRIHVLRPPASDGFSSTLGAFPASYASALWLVHVLRPTWVLEPYDTGLDFAAVLAGEETKARCLVPEGQVPAAFVEPGSPVYDGTVWKAASDAAVAHFCDPRNFLSVRDLFQFERLGYTEGVQTAEGVASILAGTFFLDPVADTDGATVDYPSLFLAAGRESGASPYFLASRALQEMGSDGTPLAFGTLPGYEGYFNLFDIGAKPDPTVENGAQVNGAKFAEFGWTPDGSALSDAEKAILLPWTSRSLAVRGAALYLVSGYIGVGQDTLYLQKFDLLPAGGLYLHQYMQNLLAPVNEGRRQYLAYLRTGLLDTPFVFRIPVFSNLPDMPADEPR